MKRLIYFVKCYYSNALLLVLLSMMAINGFSAPVSLAEATAIADVWYAMELNSGYLKISKTEKAERFTNMGNRRTQYMVSRDELVDVYPQGQRVMAYIVKYVPNGFVVVSGDDRIEPIMVCSAESKFRWDPPEENFMRYYLGKVMPALWQNMPSIIHRNWVMLRGKMRENIDKVNYDDIGRAVYVLWYTARWGQMGYYNDTCVAHNGGFDVPTGCVATAMAIKMHCHEWPLTGNSAHSYSDTLGSIQYDHSVNFGAQSYNWAAMPYDTLSSANSGVARIMYHSGVSVNMNYELGGSGAYTSTVANAMNTYFRYWGTIAKVNDTVSTHEPGMMTSIIGILPVQIGYWWEINDTVYGHSVVNDGYRDDITNQWHINCGWNGSNNGWYRLDGLPPGIGVIQVSCSYSQPNNWRYIDGAWPGAEDGRIYLPFNTLLEGEAASINGGKLLVKTGTYTGSNNVPITFDNAVAIRAFAGDVVMGENLWLMNYETIRLHGNGQLQITPAKAGE